MERQPAVVFLVFDVAGQVQMLDTSAVERGRAANDSMYLISFFQQELGQI